MIESQNKYKMEGWTSQEDKPKKSWLDGGGEILKKGRVGNLKNKMQHMKRCVIMGEDVMDCKGTKVWKETVNGFGIN